MPTDPAGQNDTGKFLDNLESTLDDEISPCVRVYELEDIKNRSDETTDALNDCIHQLACHALIDDGSDAAVEFEVQHRLIFAISDHDIKLQKDFFKVSCDKGVSHLLEICLCTMPLSLVLLQCVLAKPSMHYRSPVNCKSNNRNIPHSARISHASTHLYLTIALLKSLSAKVV